MAVGFERRVRKVCLGVWVGEASRYPESKSYISLVRNQYTQKIFPEFKKDILVHVIKTLPPDF